MIIPFDRLGDIREKHRDKKIVFVSGSFDLTHAGHVLFFEDARRYGDVLVVLVGGDEPIRRNKGPSRPILNQHLRLKMIDSLKPIDYAILDDWSHTTVHPLEILESVFRELSPDAYVVNDDGYDMPRRREAAAKYGITMIVLPRTAPEEFENISATNIIEKIKKEAE